MILNKHNLKTCNKCRAKGKSDTIKTYAFMRHFPFYEYESFYLCDNCFKELEQILIKFLEPPSHSQEITKIISQERDKRQDELNKLLFKQDKGICWFCGKDIIKNEDYKHEDFYFCSDKCIMKYNKAEREREEKDK